MGYQSGGCVWSCNVEDHLEVIKYLYSEGLKATQWGINWAAKNNHLEVVKYLRSVTLYKQMG
jgi:hypothetical protein